MAETTVCSSTTTTLLEVETEFWSIVSSVSGCSHRKGKSAHGMLKSVYWGLREVCVNDQILYADHFGSSH